MSLSDFDSTLAQVEGALAQVPVTALHLVPDLVLRSYLFDAHENAKVVRFLLSSAHRHRAFPNARASFEAVQLALLLTTDPKYDLAGAKAWVYAHRKDMKQSEQAEKAGLLEDLPGHMPAAEYFAKHFAEMQDTWNKFAPGRGALLNDAEVALDQQKKGPDNWAGVNIAAALEERVDAIPNPTGIQLPSTRPSALLRAAYALLSREAHPHSSRLEPSTVRSTADGAIEVVFQPENAAEQADLAEVLTVSSLTFAMAAFALRLRMGR